MIVLFSMKFDYATSAVMQWLHFYGANVIRINRDDYTYRLNSITSNGIYFENRRSGQIINLSEAKACWWRREGISSNCIFESPAERLTTGGLDLTLLRDSKLRDESTAILNYIRKRLLLECPVHLGDPFVTELNKLIVLDLAKTYGFKTPAYTIFTQKSQLATATSEATSRFVSKAIHEGMYNVVNNHRLYSFTEELEPNCLEEGPLFPSIAMELIEKKFEIRSFLLNGHFYSSAVFSQSSAQTQVDFRKYNQVKPNRVEPYVLPDAVADRLRRMCYELGLNCASADIIVDKDNEYVFLEINPVGQYHMVSDPCNYDLDHVIANYLMHGRRETTSA
jgi:ATP-GRASP peptide maturase of grasp-with-spasm system